MTVDPFIEAEEVAGHSVQNACRLLEVSRPPTTSDETASPRAREVTDAELLEQITAIHTESKGTYGCPADPQRAGPPPRGLREAPGDQAHAAGRPRGPVQEALAQDHGRRPRRRGGPRPHPAPLRTVRGDRPALCRRHHLHRHLGGLGLPGDGHRPGLLAGSSAGPWPITCAPNWSKTLSPWPSPTGHHEQGVIFHSDRGCQYTSGTSPSSPGPTASCSRSGARANAGTMRWPNLSSPPSSASSSTPALANGGRTSTCRLRVHRGLVQHPPAALDARLPQPRSIRSCPPQRRPSGGIINTTNLSVEPDQAQCGK